MSRSYCRPNEEATKRKARLIWHSLEICSGSFWRRHYRLVGVGVGWRDLCHYHHRNSICQGGIPDICVCGLSIREGTDRRPIAWERTDYGYGVHQFPVVHPGRAMAGYQPCRGRPFSLHYDHWDPVWPRSLQIGASLLCPAREGDRFERCSQGGKVEGRECSTGQIIYEDLNTQP